MSLLECNESTGEMQHREIVLSVAFLPDEQAAEAVVPTVGAFDHPAPGLPPDAPDERGFAAPPRVREDPALAHRRIDIGVVAALVQT